MKKITQSIVLISLLVLIGIAAYSSIHSNKNESTNTSEATGVKEYPEIGFLAPSFSLTGLDGQSHDLSEYRGKPIILNFWASWCGPCIEEAPNFVKLHTTYRNDLQIVTVNLTSMDNVQSAKDFVKEYGFIFPVLLDQDGTVAQSYKIKPIPTTFFIDSQGLIVDGVYGGLTWTDLESRTKQLLQTDYASN